MDGTIGDAPPGISTDEGTRHTSRVALVSDGPAFARLTACPARLSRRTAACPTETLPTTATLLLVLFFI